MRDSLTGLARPSYSFRTKTAVVTGAAGDLGSAVSLALSAAGAEVIAVDLQLDRLERVVSRARELHGQIFPVQADVTSEVDVARYAEVAASRGGVDLFFNNAGIEGRASPIVKLSLEEFRHVQEVNVIGVLAGLRAILPLMKAGGSIVNTASMAALRGSADMAAYVSSKHAVLGLTRTASIEAAALGLRVNAVCPGPIQGRMMQSIEQQRAVLGGSAGGGTRNYAEIEDVVDVVLYLFSDGSRLLNGQALEMAQLT